jgi:uncharacterized membrane protein
VLCRAAKSDLARLEKPFMIPVRFHRSARCVQPPSGNPQIPTNLPRQRCVFGTLVAALVCCGDAAWAQSSSFTLIGNPEAGRTRNVVGVSPDGRFVAGTNYLWDRDRLTLVNELNASPFNSIQGISADGRFAAGISMSTTAPSRAFRYDRDARFATPLPLPTGAVDTRGQAISPDGSVVYGLGRTQDVFFQAIRWSSRGAEWIPHPRGFFSSNFKYVSGDGRVAFGDGAGATSGIREAITWTEAGGWTVLPVPGLTGYTTEANGISFDGSVVVAGVLPTRGTPFSMKWVNGTPQRFQDAGAGVNDFHEQVETISGDGRVAGGLIYNPITSELTATVWVESNAPVSLNDYLVMNGVVLPSGFRLRSCNAISFDGTTFAGIGDIAGGLQSVAFTATIPGPGTVLVPGLAGAWCALRRRRMRSG